MLSAFGEKADSSVGEMRANLGHGRNVLTAVLLLCFGSWLQGQDVPCQQSVSVNVLDGNGNPLQGLGAGHFRGRFRGKPVRILSVTREVRSPRIVMLLDTSDSMVGRGASGKWELAWQVARDIILRTPPKNSVALVTFADEVDRQVNFADNPNPALLEELAALKAGRKAFPKGRRRTALYDAILAALAMLQPPQAGDVVYVITDGWDNASRARIKQIEGALLSSGVRLFTSLLINSRVLLAGWPEPLENFVELVKTTGGNRLDVFSTPIGPVSTFDLAEKERAVLQLNLEQLYREMTEYYRLEVEPQRRVDKPRKWKLELAEIPGVSKKDLGIVYQHKLAPCSAPTSSK